MAKKRADGLYEKTITINGKQKHFYGKTKKEALRKAFSYQEEQTGGIALDKLCEEYYEAYISDHPSSERYVKSHIRRMISTFGDRKANTLTPKDFTSFLYSMADKSQKTVSACKSVAQCVYNFGIVNYGLTDNPVEKRKLPPFLEKGSREIPTPEEISIIKNAKDVPNALLFQMALYTGMRRGELLALQFKDIDLERGIIKVCKSIYYTGNDPILKEPKTKRGNRSVPLLEPLQALLPTGKPNDYVFGGSKPYTAKMVQRRIESFRKATGLDVSLHQLRHWYATILYEAGIDERMAMDILGHRNISTTRDIYTHISEQKRDEAIRELNAFVKNIV